MGSKWSLALLAAAGLLAASAPAASADTTCAVTPAAFPSLGDAGGYTVFALGGAANFSNDTVIGDVAVAAGAGVTNQAPSTIAGDVSVAAGASFGGPGKVTGPVFTGKDLGAARAAALAASAQAAGLPASVTYADVTKDTTVTGVSGVNVVDVTGSVSLSNAWLTLAGPADAFFVVNVGGSIKLVGTGGIRVGDGIAPGQLLVNLTGSGAGLVNTHVGNVVQGTLLGPNAGGSLDGAFGSLLLGQRFSLMSGVKVSYQGCPPYGGGGSNS
jgi:hypothetical protein